MVLASVSLIEYMYGEANINEKLVELELTTVKDFTIQGKIPAALYAEFTSTEDADG